MYYADCWGAHAHWFWILPFLFMVLFFAFAACRIRRAGNYRWDPGRRTGWAPFGWCGFRQDSTAREILDRRYASGEITKEEYERIKRDMEKGPSQSEPRVES